VESLNPYNRKQKQIDELRKDLLKKDWFEFIFGVPHPRRIVALHYLEKAEEHWKQHRDQDGYDRWFADRERLRDDVCFWVECCGGRTVPVRICAPMKAELSFDANEVPTDCVEAVKVPWPDYRPEIPFWYRYFLETGLII